MQTPASTIITTGDLGGQKIKMKFDENSIAKLLSIMTDLYSDSEQAVIREYATNAWDSHVQAGNTAPIEIFSPNALSPNYIVKDQGVGLSVSDIEDIYSQYGASTKTGSDDTNGMLGLGAKSALSLVPQFHLISVKDGIKITVMVSRSSDGGGQMEIVDTKATDESNGVEIRIPVPRTSSFMAKVRNFFRFWPEGTVLVDGQAPERIKGRPVGDKFLVDKGLQKDYIVMGNVAYPCNTSLYEYGSSWNQLGIVAFVDIGDVNFAPSREELHYNPHTEATIKRLQREFSAELKQSAQDDVERADTYADAYKRAAEWRTSFYNRIGPFFYKGTQVPNDIPLVTEVDEYNRSESIQGKTVNLSGRNPRYANWIRSVNPSMLDQNVFITGFAESLKMSPVQRERARIYFDQKGWVGNQVVLFKQDEIITDATHLKYVEDIRIVPWSEIAKIKIVRAKNAAGKVVRAEKYDVWNEENGRHEASDFDTARPIVYVSTAEQRNVAWINKIIPGVQVAHIGANRWDKFKRDWPTAKHYAAAINDARDALVAQFTESDKILWRYSDSYLARAYRMLDAEKIDDPALKNFVSVINGKKEFSLAAKTVREWPNGYNRPDISSVESPLTKYPLADSLGSSGSEHAHWYLNTYFAHLNSTKEN